MAKKEKDLDEYQERMLEIEEEKLETLKGIRKDMKRHQRMQSIYKTIEELGVDKEDVVFLVKYVLNKIDEYRGKESEISEEVKNIVTNIAGENSDKEFHIEFNE